MQGFLSEATRLGNPLGFRVNAVGIVDSVRAHSPDALAVLFQTWAYGSGHGAYPRSFADPLWPRFNRARCGERAAPGVGCLDRSALSGTSRSRSIRRP